MPHFVSNIGLSFGLMYLPAIVCVTFYFKKLRSLATGIAVCGSGIGTLIFALSFEYLVTNYKWQKTLIFTSGFGLFCIICGMMFRPLESDTKSETKVSNFTFLNDYWKTFSGTSSY